MTDAGFPEDSDSMSKPVSSPAQEGVFRAIELAQTRFKIVADLGIKGIIFHLGISAFSLGVVFGQKGVPRSVIIVANALVTVLALLSALLVRRDAACTRRRIIEWHRCAGMPIDSRELRGLLTTAVLYAIVCLALLALWVVLLFVPVQLQAG